jgi:type II secretory pathway predicted ATPase ExeA
MFLEYFKLWDEPFGVTPDPAYLYPSHTHLHALDSLRNGILSGRGFMTLIAEPGMGKTTLLYQLIEQMPQTTRTAYLFQTQCNSLEFMQYLITELGVDPNGMGLVAMHRRLNEMLFNEMVQGKQFVLIVDESQNLSNAVLETIRLLSNFETAHSKLLQIVLAGQPELANKLKQPELSQLLQRITVMASLDVLSFEETAAYIRHRLKLAGHNGNDLFDPAALAAVYRRSKGVPRNINRVCHAGLELAAAEQAQFVTAAIVEKSNRGLGATVEDLQRSRFESQPRQVPLLNVPPQVVQQDRSRPPISQMPPQTEFERSTPAETPTPEDTPAPMIPEPLPQAAHPAPVAHQQFAQPLPDFVPMPPQRRSYRWLAWATVFTTLLILGFLAAPASLRNALLRRIQPVAGSSASINASRPIGTPDSKSPIPPPRHNPTPSTDSSGDIKVGAAMTRGPKIVIDPGHGGSDVGARGPSGLVEKSVCLEVALRLGQLIEDGIPGAEVIYTRSDDQNISLQRRGAAASDSAANLFVSIHADSRGDGQEPQAYYPGTISPKRSRRALHAARDSSRLDLALKLASSIQAALVQEFALKSEPEPLTAPDQPAFLVLSAIKVPAVLVELPFVEGSPLLEPDQRQKVAESLYRGIAAFLKEQPGFPGVSPTN